MSLTTIRNSLNAMRLNLGGEEATPGTNAVYDLIPTLLEIVSELEQRSAPPPTARCQRCAATFVPYFPYGNRSGPQEARYCGDCVDALVDDAKAREGTA